MYFSLCFTRSAVVIPSSTKSERENPDRPEKTETIINEENSIKIDLPRENSWNYSASFSIPIPLIQKKGYQRISQTIFYRDFPSKTSKYNQHETIARVKDTLIYIDELLNHHSSTKRIHHDFLSIMNDTLKNKLIYMNERLQKGLTHEGFYIEDYHELGFLLHYVLSNPNTRSVTEKNIRGHLIDGDQHGVHANIDAALYGMQLGISNKIAQYLLKSFLCSEESNIIPIETVIKTMNDLDTKRVLSLESKGLPTFELKQITKSNSEKIVTLVQGNRKLTIKFDKTRTEKCKYKQKRHSAKSHIFDGTASRFHRVELMNDTANLIPLGFYAIRVVSLEDHDTPRMKSVKSGEYLRPIRDQELDILDKCDAEFVAKPLLYYQDTKKKNTGTEKKVVRDYLLYELADKSLQAYIAPIDINNKPAPPSDFATQLVKAVKHIHSKNIVHFDIKPANILVYGNRLKLTDVDLAMDLSESDHLQHIGIKGTVHYIAPEMIMNEIEHTREGCMKLDLWSLGVVLFELYTSLYLFDVLNIDNTSKEHIFRSFKQLDHTTAEIQIKESLKNVDTKLSHLIEALLKLSPQERSWPKEDNTGDTEVSQTLSPMIDNQSEQPNSEDILESLIQDSQEPNKYKTIKSLISKYKIQDVKTIIRLCFLAIDQREYDIAAFLYSKLSYSPESTYILMKNQMCHLSVRVQKQQFLQFAINQGNIDLNHKDSQNRTSLDVALEKRYYSGAVLLITSGATLPSNFSKSNGYLLKSLCEGKHYSDALHVIDGGLQFGGYDVRGHEEHLLELALKRRRYDIAQTILTNVGIHALGTELNACKRIYHVLCDIRNLSTSKTQKSTWLNNVFRRGCRLISFCIQNKNHFIKNSTLSQKFFDRIEQPSTKILTKTTYCYIDPPS